MYVSVCVCLYVFVCVCVCVCPCVSVYFNEAKSERQGRAGGLPLTWGSAKEAGRPKQEQVANATQCCRERLVKTKQR